MIIYTKNTEPFDELKDNNPELIYCVTNKLRNISLLINETFNLLYHERVKDLPGRATRFWKNMLVRYDNRMNEIKNIIIL